MVSSIFAEFDTKKQDGGEGGHVVEVKEECIYHRNGINIQMLICMLLLCGHSTEDRHNGMKLNLFGLAHIENVHKLK